MAAPAALPLILIVEDEIPMRRFLRTFLVRQNFRVHEAGSGQETVEIALAHPPDLVILDLGLPDIDGQDLLVRLREWLAAPIIVLSVRDEDKQKIKALNHGADDYLTKPFSAGELL